MNQSGKKYYFIVFSIISCSLPVNLLAQSSFGDGLKVEINYHQGIILPEHDLLTPIEEENTKSIELNFLKETQGKNNWEKLYNFPEYGLSVRYVSLGHNRVLGNLIGLDYFFKVHFLHHSKFHIYGQSGIGVNYLSKIHDPIENPLNGSMSSHFNFHYNLRLGVNIKLIEKTGLNLGSSFDHISNANFKFPNRGINSVSFYGGLTYNIGQTLEKEEIKLEAHQRKMYVEAILNSGFRHATFVTDRYYLVPSIALELNNQTFRILHLGIGGEFFHDQSVQPKFELTNTPYQKKDSYQSGVYFSQAIVYSKFKFIIQEGFYLWMSEKLDRKKFFNRIVFKYNVTSNLSFHISLMSELQNLQYNIVGVGYKF